MLLIRSPIIFIILAKFSGLNEALLLKLIWLFPLIQVRIQYMCMGQLNGPIYIKLIVYEKRASLPLHYFSQCSKSGVYSNYTNIFSLAKDKIILKNVNPCLLYDTQAIFLYLAIHLHKMEQIFVIYPFQRRMPFEER